MVVAVIGRNGHHGLRRFLQPGAEGERQGHRERGCGHIGPHPIGIQAGKARLDKRRRIPPGEGEVRFVFYPDGGARPAAVRLRSREAEQVLRCGALTGAIEIADPETAAPTPLWEEKKWCPAAASRCWKCWWR